MTVYSARAATVMLALARAVVLTIGLTLTVSPGQTAEGRAALEAQARSLRAEVQRLVADGQLRQAIPKAERLVEVGRALFGDSHPTVETLLRDLAELYEDVGRDADAGRVRAQASRIGQRNPSAHVDDGVNRLVVRGKSYYDRGDMREAWKSYWSAKEILEGKGLTHGLQYAVVVGELGRVREVERQHDDAEAFYQRSIALAAGAGDSGRKQLAVVLNNLGNLYWKMNRLDDAARALKRSLDLTVELFGPTSPLTAQTLTNLGNVHGDNGDKARARALYLRARDVLVAAYGEDHPLLAHVYNNMAAAAWEEGEGNARDAVEWQEKANRVAAKNISDNVLLGSERQKHLYMEKFVGAGDASIAMSLSLAKGMQRAGRMAFHLLLQRKGRVMDTLARSLADIRRSMSETDRRLLDEFVALQRTKSALVYGAREPGAGQRESFDAARADTLQVLLGQRSSDFRDVVGEVTLEAVRGALPPDSALVEFVVYRPRRPARGLTYFATDPPRYAAYVLRSSGEVAWLDLGDRTAIDRLVTDFRGGLADPRRTYVKRVARRLHDKIMKDVWPHMSGAKRIFIAPDGALNLIPFGALVDSEGNYLVTRRATFSYLSSGRDLLRDTGAAGAAGNDVIVADPDYGPMKDGSMAPCTDDQRRSTRSMTEGFSRLCGTSLEASEISRWLQRPTLLRGRDATESAVKRLRRPRILHLATHGFYESGLLYSSRSAGAPGHRTDALTNLDRALLSSGIVLAGANQRRSGDDDGILTALEMVALDLGGTELVVLSACETGVGDVVAGEGVFGLRRALMLAGAESQMLSLWKISDEITARLMGRYYELLISKRKGRADALKTVQEELLSDPVAGTAHPYYWASFSLSGNWRPLSFQSR